MQNFQHGEIGIGEDEELDMPVLYCELVPAGGDLVQWVDFETFFEVVGRQNVERDACRDTGQAE